jgi:hypothetical protein
MAAEWVWDTEADADEFVQAFRDYAEARYGPAGASIAGGECWLPAGGPACLFMSGDRSLWLAAPDEATLATILAEFPGY